MEVTEKQAQAYREELRKEWRTECYENYYTTSLDAIIDAGHDIEDKRSDINNLLEDREQEFQRKVLLKKQKEVLPLLTPIQKRTIYKMFVKNMTQAEIAKEEGVSKVTLTYRVQGIYFGRSAFEEITSRYAYDDTINYMAKYIEKSGERIAYSKGLPQYFVCDIIDEDVLCFYGVDNRKLLLFDNFRYWDDGCYMGRVFERSHCANEKMQLNVKIPDKIIDFFLFVGYNNSGERK